MDADNIDNIAPSWKTEYLSPAFNTRLKNQENVLPIWNHYDNRFVRFLSLRCEQFCRCGQKIFENSYFRTIFIENEVETSETVSRGFGDL